MPACGKILITASYLETSTVEVSANAYDPTDGFSSNISRARAKKNKEFSRVSMNR